MAVLGQYTPPPSKAEPGPCCVSCASPAERQRLRSQGARLVQLAAAGGGLGDAAADPYDRLIWWPGDISAFADQANGEISTLARDWTAARGSGRITEAQFRAWRVFYDEWATYYSGLTPFAYLTSSTVAEIKSFRARLLQWRTALSQSGGALSSPAPLAADPGPAGGTAPAWLKWTAAGAIALGGAMVLGHVARTVGLFAPRRSA